MECPRCSSPDVVQLPPDTVNNKPGYLCQTCGTLMRAPWTLPLYTAVLLAGVFHLIAAAYILLDSPGELETLAGMAWCMGFGLFGVRYAALQLARPLPRRGTPEGDEV